MSRSMHIRPLRNILIAGSILCMAIVSGRAAYAAESVSLVTLIANADDYHEQTVLVSGYLTLDFEGRALYLHEDDYRHSQFKNGLWVEIDRDTYQQYNQQYIVIEGEFDAQDNGHMGLWSGGLKNIERILVAPKPK